MTSGSVDVSSGISGTTEVWPFSVLVPAVGTPLALLQVGHPHHLPNDRMGCRLSALPRRLKHISILLLSAVHEHAQRRPELGAYGEGGNMVIRRGQSFPLIFRFSDLNRSSHHPSVLTQTGNDVNCGGRRATCSQFGWLTMARVATCAGNVVGCRSSQGRQVTDVPDQVHPTSDLLGALGAAPYRPYRRHTGQPRLGFPQGCLTTRRRRYHEGQLCEWR